MAGDRCEACALGEEVVESSSVKLAISRAASCVPWIIQAVAHGLI